MRPVTPTALTLLLAPIAAVSAQGVWRVPDHPLFVLGADPADTSQLFAVVAGATRLPDGNILVGDRGPFSLHIYAPDGRHLRAFGRKGKGPGEFEYLARLWRCGDTFITWDIDGHLASVFDLSGRYVRAFRFSSPEQGTQIPYDSACNPQGIFVHMGWGNSRDLVAPTYRTRTVLWVTRADSGVTRTLGTIPGSERYVHQQGGIVRGSQPLPLGRETRLAIGVDRVYAGTAERDEILVFDLSRRPLSPLRAGVANASLTKADIDAARDLALASARPSRHAAITAQYASYPFPKTLPPYRALVVDANDNLWVQDYPRPTSPTVRWTIIGPTGNRLGEVRLSRHLEVFEIGADYILGRYLDPDLAIPEVRLYHLERPRR